MKTVLHVVCGSLNPDSKVMFWRKVCNTLVNKLAQQFWGRRLIRLIICGKINTVTLKLQTKTSLRVSCWEFFFLKPACSFCSRLCSGPFSKHPAHYRRASISYPVQNRAASAGEGTSPSTSIIVRASATVSDELWLTCLVGGWYSWPWPANWCCKAWRKSHWLPHSERPWTQLHGCPAQLQSNKSCTAAITYIHTALTPSVPSYHLSVDRLSTASTHSKRRRPMWGHAQSGTNFRGWGEQGKTGSKLDPDSSTSYSHRSGREACFSNQGQWKADGGSTNETPHTQLLREETEEDQEGPQGRQAWHRVRLRWLLLKFDVTLFFLFIVILIFLITFRVQLLLFFFILLFWLFIIIILLIFFWWQWKWGRGRKKEGWVLSYVSSRKLKASNVLLGVLTVSLSRFK